MEAEWNTILLLKCSLRFTHNNLEPLKVGIWSLEPTTTIKNEVAAIQAESYKEDSRSIKNYQLFSDAQVGRYTSFTAKHIEQIWN